MFLVFSGLVLLECILLFFLSRWLVRQLVSVLGPGMYAVLFFPGILLHEFAHFFAAMVLFVRTGKITLFPERQPDGTMRLGSVAIVKTDPIRRFLIGIAPVLIGLAVIFWVLAVFSPASSVSAWLRLPLTLFSVFWVGNTMFSSRKDMEGALELFIVVALILVGAWIVGVRLPEAAVGFLNGGVLTSVVRRATLLLLVPIATDTFLLTVLRMKR